MNVSKEIRSTLIKSGDRMTVAEIHDAIGGLADKSFVAAICVQHFKKGSFGRAMEDGRMVYWILDPKTASANDDSSLEEKGADSGQFVQVFAEGADTASLVVVAEGEPPMTPAEALKRELASKPKPIAAKPRRSAQDQVHDRTTNSASTTAQLNDFVKEVQADRILRMERTSQTLGRILSNLLSDAIDAQLEHDVLRQLSNAQLAVQEVHGYLINVG